MVLSGCPGSIDEEMFRASRESSTQTDATSEGGTSNCPSDVNATIIMAKCATAGCHSTMARAGSLDLESPNLGSRLIGVAATSAACAPRMLVTVTNGTADGVLFGRLLENPPCGLRMPLGMPGLSANEIACLRSYVATLPTGGSDGGTSMDASAPMDAGNNG